VEHVQYRHHEWFAMDAVVYIALVAEKARPCFEDVLWRWRWVGTELLEESADLRALRLGSA
jgi:hypothetical protein